MMISGVFNAISLVCAHGVVAPYQVLVYHRGLV